MRFRLLISIGPLLLLGLLPAQARAADPGPALSVSPEDAAAALTCPKHFAGTHEPVLFIHGTSYTATQAWSWNYGKVLPPQGFDVCTVQLPDLARADIQVSAEYVVSAIRTIAGRSHSKVDLVSFSQGPMEARWALKWWPDLRGMVDDSIMLAAPNHGFRAGDVLCTPSCIAPFWQMRVRSAFITALNRDDETPGDVSYTSVYSRTDQFLQPTLPNDGTASLLGGTTIAVQDVCPARAVEHIGMVSDALVYAVVMDALTHPGPAVFGRIDPSVCAAQYMPGVEARDAESDRVGFYQNAPGLLAQHHTPDEPPLAAYASAGGD
jgi:triacylglycerol esterase/lipase EstA (alpha/beta hydrolase family)